MKIINNEVYKVSIFDVKNSTLKDVTINGDISSEIINFLLGININKLWLNGVSGSSFIIFQQIASKVKQLTLNAIDISSEGIETFINIEMLKLDEPLYPLIDFNLFKNLDNIKISWDSKYKTDFFSSQKLKKMFIRFLSHNDCEHISKASNLHSLSIVQSKLKTLKGIQKLKSLKNLLITDNRRLEDISSLEKLPNLETLYICNCPKLKNVDSIKALKNIRKIELLNMKNVIWKDLNWIENLKELEYFNNECEVKKIEWSKVLSLNNIIELSTNTYNGCDISDNELFLKSKNNLKTLVNIERFPTKQKPTICFNFEKK